MALLKYEILGISFIVRLLSMLVIYILPIPVNLKIILILAADFLDCWTAKAIDFIQEGTMPFKNPHCKEFSYQITDKVVDLLSYLIVLQLLPQNPLYLVLIVGRALGVSMFYKTRDSHWLIYLPDLFKEMAIYEMFVGPLNAYSFGIITGLKIGFEYIWHTYVNGNHYKWNGQTIKMDIKNYM